MTFIEGLKRWAGQMKLDALTAWYISRNADTPWHIRIFALLLVGYVFSPVDLIPDFIPVIGYLDDLLIVPAGVYLLLRMTPENLVSEARQRACAHLAARRCNPTSRLGVFLAIVLWSAAILATVTLVRRALHHAP